MLSEFAVLLIGAILINNFVLVQFLGLCPFMGVSKKVLVPKKDGLYAVNLDQSICNLLLFASFNDIKGFVSLFFNLSLTFS